MKFSFFFKANVSLRRVRRFLLKSEINPDDITHRINSGKLFHTSLNHFIYHRKPTMGNYGTKMSLLLGTFIWNENFVKFS